MKEVMRNGSVSHENGSDLEEGSQPNLGDQKQHMNGAQSEELPMDEAPAESAPDPSTKESPNSLSLVTSLLIIVLVGCGAAAAFMSVGIVSAQKKAEDDFDRQSSQVISTIATTWLAYETAGLHVHEMCRSSRRNIYDSFGSNVSACSREEFRELYESLISTGLTFQVTSFNPNVSSPEEREALEQESRDFYADHHPEYNYTGIRGLEPNSNGEGVSVQLRSTQPFYYPVHLLEPVEGNQGAIDFDLYSSSSRRTTIHQALSTWKPALTPRLSLVQETDPSAYSVILLHPGVPHPLTDPDLVAKDLSSMVVRIPDLLTAATTSLSSSSLAYIYDSTPVPQTEDGLPPEPPKFLGGVRVDARSATSGVPNTVTFLAEVDFDALQSSADKRKRTKIRQRQVDIANRKWTVVVVSIAGSYEPSHTAVILGGALIFCAGLCVAVWVYTAVWRHSQMARLVNEAQAERSRLIVENATQAARAQRELNDFIAHEVRNPLSAAMSACNFVKSALMEEESRRTGRSRSCISISVEDGANPRDGRIDSSQHREQPQQGGYIPNDKDNLDSAREDVSVIESSLHFINDLLRNMLDFQRAASNQLHIEFAPTDVAKDVLYPVNAMLYRTARDGGAVKIMVDCQRADLMVSTDRLRLKQVMLNLARNATKFVEKGFIRLGAYVVLNAKQEEECHMFIEDSGCGIPKDKQGQLFRKFQSSLDELNQGTGVGLSLCLNLCQLMGADIWLDTDYHSGLEGSPGTRFVINLKKPPLNALAGMGSEHSSSRATALMDEEEEEDEERAEFGNHVGPGQLTGGTANGGGSFRNSNASAAKPVLPEKLKVLFVDDDLVLRKLFSRSIKRSAPGWEIHEASSGEMALDLVIPNQNANNDNTTGSDVSTSNDFDLLFVDQYMASVEKQLLGTETVRALRAQGVACRICGLSANDVESTFLEAGADAFMFKPFPCEKDELTRELLRVLGLS